MSDRERILELKLRDLDRPGCGCTRCQASEGVPIKLGTRSPEELFIEHAHNGNERSDE